jgi:hypothetical protein
MPPRPVVPLFALACLLALIRVSHAAQPKPSEAAAPAAESEALAQDPSAPATAPQTGETFFPAPTRVRLVAGPWTRLTLLGSRDFAVLAGGGGGLLFFDHLLVMGYAASLASRTAPGDTTRRFALASVGGQIAWIFKPQRRLHCNIGALVGSTSATITAKGNANDSATLDYLTLEPYAEIEASLYLGLKLFAGGGYRILAGNGEQAGIDSSYLRGPTLEFGFRMGN